MASSGRSHASRSRRPRFGDMTERAAGEGTASDANSWMRCWPPAPNADIGLDVAPDTRYVSQCDPSFADKRTAAIWVDRMPKGFPNDLAKVARRKLRMLASAITLEDLRNPP